VIEVHLHGEAIRLVGVLLVVALPRLADLLQALVVRRTPHLGHRIEGVLRLARGDDVADKAQEVALAHCVGGVAGETEGGAEGLLRDARLGADGLLVLVDHALVLAHLRDEPAAEIPVADVLRLALVVLEVAQEGLMLHDQVVDLALVEVVTAIHGVFS
jgi:hypothetical protein